MQIRIDSIKSPVWTDGPGKRASLYTVGCPIRCVGCQSPQLFEMSAGRLANVEAVADELYWTGLDISILGGEPLFQADALAELLAAIRSNATRSHVEIIVYTGYTWEQVKEMQKTIPAITDILRRADILVDGPFIYQQDDPFVQYRGSRNQRPIDLRATEDEGRLVVLDWDTCEIIIHPDGTVLGAAGWIDLLSKDIEGDVEDARRCGQTR